MMMKLKVCWWAKFVVYGHKRNRSAVYIQRVAHKNGAKQSSHTTKRQAQQCRRRSDGIPVLIQLQDIITDSGQSKAECGETLVPAVNSGSGTYHFELIEFRHLYLAETQKWAQLSPFNGYGRATKLSVLGGLWPAVSGPAGGCTQGPDPHYISALAMVYSSATSEILLLPLITDDTKDRKPNFDIDRLPVYFWALGAAPSGSRDKRIVTILNLYALYKKLSCMYVSVRKKEALFYCGLNCL